MASQQQDSIRIQVTKWSRQSWTSGAFSTTCCLPQCFDNSMRVYMVYYIQGESDWGKGSIDGITITRLGKNPMQVTKWSGGLGHLGHSSVFCGIWEYLDLDMSTV